MDGKWAEDGPSGTFLRKKELRLELLLVPSGFRPLLSRQWWGEEGRLGAFAGEGQPGKHRGTSSRGKKVNTYINDHIWSPPFPDTNSSDGPNRNS